MADLTGLARLGHHVTPGHVGQGFEFGHVPVQFAEHVGSILEQNRHGDNARQHGDGAETDGR
jgi:hypothetical protein